MRTCEWCGDSYQPSRKNQKYCVGKGCNVQAYNASRRAAAPKSVAPEIPNIPDQDVIRLAEERGFVIHKPEPQAPVVEFDTSRIQGDRVKVAFVSDTHIGSKYQQVTHLLSFMKYAVERGVDCFIHGGDATDGPHEAHRGAIHEMWAATYDAQVEAFLRYYPETGIPTHLISGNHDEFFLKNAGGDIAQEIARRREDITYLGRSQGYMRFGNVLLQVVHPHDGTSYALSYKLQKRIEQLAPENKPHILALGNYHKAAHLPAYRNVEGFLLPAFQSQTAFMASKGLASIVGGLILEFGVDPKGIAPSVGVEWVLYREPVPGDWPAPEAVA